ncbi:putative NmrA-like family domain-containing protein 1 [Cadophora sp. DSE1049]|nr:putative NmrA-like family domain-containing protein 1 [Cadophora sp. DSE1049]
MSDKKVIVVFGATGAQGGSVVKSLLTDSKLKEQWHVRAVTRDITKPAAKALKDLGAEPVVADLNDAASLKKVVEGAYAVFAVTNYWEFQDAAIEIKQGTAIADAAKEAGVQHFIWSSLPHVTELSKGALPNVYHFDSKADVEKYIRSIDLPATFLLLGFYASNLDTQLFTKGQDGAYAIHMPFPGSALAPVIDTQEDTGKFVKGILLNREKTLGKQILAAEKYYSFDEIVADFREVFPNAGKTARFTQIPDDMYRGFIQSIGMSAVVAQELLENMKLMDQFGYYGKEPLDFSHSILVDKLTTWKEHAKKALAYADLN